MDSRTYWRLREEAWIKQRIKDDKLLAKKIAEELTLAREDIQRDIDAFYTKYAKAEGITIHDAMQKVAKHDVERFANRAKRYVEARDFSPRANQELRLYNATMKINRLELLKADINLRLTGATDDINHLIQDSVYGQATAEYERNAGILGDSAKHNIGKAVKEVVQGSYKGVAVFDDRIGVFSDNIWLYKAELMNDLEKMLVRSFTKGENPRVIARELKKKFNVTGYQAERLARTESSRIASALQKVSYRDSGIKQYEYIAEFTACKVCADLNGKIFNVDKMVVGKNANPMHPNCVCSTAPYVSSKAMYDDWLRRGIISKKEYQSLDAFKKDYDKKFDFLMKLKIQHEKLMQEKRKARRL